MLMNDEAIERLRELARLHAEGELSRRDYLSMRTGLLDAVTGYSQLSAAGEPMLHDSPVEHPLPEESLAGRLAADRALHEELADEARKPAVATRTASRNRLPIMGAALAVGFTVVVLVAFWLVFAVPDSGPAVSTMGMPPMVPVAEGRPSAQSQVEAFRARNDWSRPAIRNFLSVWEALPESTRREALAAAWFKPLADELNERIATQQALADTQGPDGEPGEHETLVAFAERLGLRE